MNNKYHKFPKDGAVAIEATEEDSVISTAVNAWIHDDHEPGFIEVAFLVDGTWHTNRLLWRDAIQLADQLRLLTRTSD